MNTRAIAILALGVTLSGTSLADSSKLQNAYGYYASRIDIEKWNGLLYRTQKHEVVAGASRDLVQRQLGQPMRTLSPDVWMYDNCQPNFAKARNEGCTLLVITFDRDNRVAEMKFVNQPLLTQIAASLDRERTERLTSR